MNDKVENIDSAIASSTDDSKKLDLLCSRAQDIINFQHNNLNNSIRNHLASLQSGGYDFSDTLHNVYCDYGYPPKIDFFSFWNMYRRFGIAKNVVEMPVDTGWMTSPTIESDNQEFVKAFEAFVKRTKFWVRLKGLDTRQRVGRYGGMFMRVKDGNKPDVKLEGTLNGESALMEMMPLYESQLKVLTTDEDPMSETFGQPLTLQFSQAVAGNRNERTLTTITIHASRIVFAAEDSDNEFIYGISSLESVFNSLMDLRKIIGAGGEGFYRNAAQSLTFELKDGAGGANLEAMIEGFSEQADDFIRHRFRRNLITPGLTPKTLDSKLINPKDFFNIALNDVAAGSKIPATILIGQQTGRLASNEDAHQFLATVQSRRLNFMTEEIVRKNIDWLMQFGILPSAEYGVVWDDLLARSDAEKLDNADKMASTNQKQFQSGGERPFTGAEIREAAGFDPLPDEEEGSEHLDDEDDEDDET